MTTTNIGVGQEIRVRFPRINKNDTLDGNDKWASQEGENVEDCVVKKVVELSLPEWEEVTNSLLASRPNMWGNIGGQFSDDPRLEGVPLELLWSDNYYMNIFRDTCKTDVIRVTLKKEDDEAVNGDEVRVPHFFVNTEGYDYARYVGRIAAV
tara:strand:- start:2336 stop:2791 length:456 start_codon:yes stop_codon:yes gene_type:complete